MIADIKITKLKQIMDERGKIMHMMRIDNPIFKKFGEIYFSTVKPKFIKAWHLHKEATLNYVCIKGKVKLVLFDDRKGKRDFWKVSRVNFISRRLFYGYYTPASLEWI